MDPKITEPHPPPTGGSIRISSPSCSTVSIPLRNAMSCPLTISRICGRGVVVLGSNRCDASSSPQVSTILRRSFCKVVCSGTEIWTSLLPRILLKSKIVRTLSVINAIPFRLTLPQQISQKAALYRPKRCLLPSSSIRNRIQILSRHTEQFTGVTRKDKGFLLV